MVGTSRLRKHGTPGITYISEQGLEANEDAKLLPINHYVLPVQVEVKMGRS